MTDRGANIGRHAASGGYVGKDADTDSAPVLLIGSSYFRLPKSYPHFPTKGPVRTPMSVADNPTPVKDEQDPETHLKENFDTSDFPALNWDDTQDEDES